MNNKTLIILIIGAFMILIGIPVVAGIVGYFVIRNSVPEMSEITFDENVSDVSFSDNGLINLYEGDGFTFRYPDKYTESYAYPTENKFVENEIGLWDDISRINSDVTIESTPNYRIFSEKTNQTLDSYILEYFDLTDDYVALGEIKDRLFQVDNVRYGQHDFVRIKEGGMGLTVYYFTKNGDRVVGIVEGFPELDEATNQYAPTVDTISIISSLNFE